MKKVLLSICLCLISHFLISQNVNENLLHIRDSLKNELNASVNEAKTADILRHIALTHNFINMDSVIYYGQKFISVCEKSDYKNRQLDALGIVGEAYIYKGELPTVRWDRRVHLARDDLDAFIERHRKVPEQAAWMEERQEGKRAWLADQEHHRTEQENDGR